MAQNPFGGNSFSASSYASIAHSADHNVGKSPLSIEIAFKTAAAGPLVNKHDGTNGWKLEVNAAGEIVATLNALTITAGTGLLDAAWHYVGIVADFPRRRAYLFIDGEAAFPTDISALSALDSTATLYLAKDGSAYLTGSLSEFRLSGCARLGPTGDTNSTGIPVRQFSDDLYTLCLVHFNEGRGVTAYDYSAYHHHATLTTGAYVAGPTRCNPVTVARECLWLAIDSDAFLTSYLDSIHCKKYRLRPGEAFPTAADLENTPSLTIYPTAIEELAPETYGNILREMIPFAIDGRITMKDVAEVEYFFHFVWKAAEDAFLAGGGAYYTDQIQNVTLRPPRIWTEPVKSQYIGEFQIIAAVEYRVPRE